jgi:hypothetical protein
LWAIQDEKGFIWFEIPVGGRDPLSVAAQVPFPHGMAPVAQASQVLR